MMPPLFMTVRMDRHRLWLPLFLLWVLLLPLLLVVAPFALVVLIVARVNPLRGVAAMWRVVVAIGGTQIEMKDGSEKVFIHIY